MEGIGKLCSSGSREELNFEWKIQSFSKRSTYFESPIFYFAGAQDCVLLIYLYKSTEYVGLFLHSTMLKLQSATINMSMGLKTADGMTAELKSKNLSTRFSRNGWTSFISQSQLMDRKAELLPSDTLTVICTLEKGPRNDDISQLQEDFKNILESGDTSDIVLKVEGEEFQSHRCVLAARSPVFKAMVTNEMKEKRTGVVDIPDIDSSSFADFLKYIYTGSEEFITQENAIELYKLGDKYQVNKLKKSCLDYIMKTMSVDNFCDIVSSPVVQELDDLTDVCSKFFTQNITSIEKTPQWLQFVKENPIASMELYAKKLENSINRI